MVTSPTSLNPPKDRRSISIDDYQPPSPTRSSSSESDNDENDTPTPLPSRPQRRRAPRKSSSSISLDSLDRDELADEVPTSAPAPLNKRPRVDPSPPKQSSDSPRPAANDKAPPAPTASPKEMEPEEPITDDNLVNIASLPSTDDFAWDRFIFFSHRSQRYEFPEDSYLSNFSPFSAVASAMIGLTTRSVCAVCGAGGTLYSCIRCPLAFHAPCADPLRTTPISRPWMCPACKAVKNGDLTAEWYPAQNRQPPPLPDPSTGLQRLIADAREGNPLDMVFSPSLFNYYKKIAGADWLRCSRCGRIRLITDGVVSEAVRVPFECAYAFWISPAERQCNTLADQKHYARTEQRVIQYIRSRKTQRQLLFRFGFDEEDACAYGKADTQNLPVLQPVKPLHAQLKQPPSPMQISPATSPTAPPRQQVPAQRAQPVKPVVAQRPQPQTTLPRQIVPSAAQLMQPQVGSASVTPQTTPQTAPRSAVPVHTAAAPPVQPSATTSATTSDPTSGGMPKSEPLENAQNNQQDLLTFIASIDWEEWLEDALTDLALANNKQLLQLYVALQGAPSKFQRQAKRLAQRMKGDMRPQPQPAAQPQQQPQMQRQAMPMQRQRQPQPQQVQMQVQQASRQPAPQGRLHQNTVDAMFRQMAIRHVREMQELEQQFMRRMEQVPATQVSELMGMKDVTIAKLKHRQQEEIRQFYQAHGMR